MIDQIIGDAVGAETDICALHLVLEDRIALPDAAVTAIAVPFVQLFAYVVLSIVAAIVAAILPARRAAKMDVLAAISHA